MALATPLNDPGPDALDVLIAREEASLLARTEQSHELHADRMRVARRRRRVVVAGRPAVPGVDQSRQGLARVGRRRQRVRRPARRIRHDGGRPRPPGDRRRRSAGGSALGTHFAQPVPDLIPVSVELARRFGLPLWRFANSGTEATMAALHLMRAVTGRQRIIKVEGSYHGHHDAVQVSVYPEADRRRATRPAPPGSRAHRRLDGRSPPRPTSCRSAGSTPCAGSCSPTPARSRA